MPKLKMTDATVRQTTAEAGRRIDYFDAHPRDRQRGLVLRVTGTRRKDGQELVSRSWAVLCRVAGTDKLRRFTIGEYPGIGLGEARMRAAEIIRRTRDGVDPLEVRREELAERIEAERETVAAVAEAFVEYGKTKRGRSWTPRYKAEVERNIRNHVLPRWAHRSITSITKRDVEALLDAVAEEGTKIRGPEGDIRLVKGGEIAANRVAATVRALFNFAVRRGRIDASPVVMVDRRGEETERERVLTDEEIKLIWPQIEALGYPFSTFFKLLLLTGQRRSEVAAMTWAEVDLDAKTWIIPSVRTKNHREHVVPLTDMALAALQEAKRHWTEMVPSMQGAPDFVLTTTGKTPISGFSRAKAILDKLVATVQADDDLPTIPDWRIHDLRRTCATGMQRLGIALHVTEAVLNHISGSRAGIVGVYQRHHYAEEKRAALTAWGAHVMRLVDDAGSAVALPMTRGR